MRDNKGRGIDKVRKYAEIAVMAGVLVLAFYGVSPAPPPPPPPPGVPAGQVLAPLVAVGGIIVYGAWKARRRK